MRPAVTGFLDEATGTVSYVAADPGTGAAVIIDSVLDFDPHSGRTSTGSADRLIGFVREKGLRVERILETHVHADHLSAASCLKQRLGGRIGIGERIGEVQRTFRHLFNAGPDLAADGSVFDDLLADGERFRIGGLEARCLHTPGHTPIDMTYVIGDAAFVGDTLFMPDYGTARVDFPGGDAHALYRSIRRILDLAPQTRLFTGHDYKAPDRDRYAWESTVAEQRARNVHVRDGVTEDEFVALRRGRDATLETPRLFLPSIQVNIRAGRLPPPEDNGIRYLKIPLDAL